MDAATALTTTLALLLLAGAVAGALLYRHYRSELSVARGGEIMAERERDATERRAVRLERELAHEIERARTRATPPDPLEEFIGNELVVHTRRPDDQTVRGTVHAVGPVWLQLVNARYLGTQYAGGEAAAEGLVFVPRGGISSTQVLSASVEVARVPAPSSNTGT